ncbi:MAG: hypothetical protein KAI50_04950 [Desulfobacterales bacterium]|nr:hypothetical protein [Desulfobacterales bacterium]
MDALRNQFAGPSKEMMDTIFVAKNQVKDGFFTDCWDKLIFETSICGE